MTYHLENHLQLMGTIYYTGEKMLPNGSTAPDFCWDRNKAKIFYDYEEAKIARDHWGGTSRVAEHE